MRFSFLTMLLLVWAGQASGQEVGEVHCGSRNVGEMLGEGWHVVKHDYVQRIGDHRIRLDDGSLYQADMTSGILPGDPALLLVKHVRSKKDSGDIYTLCAGGFDAWVRQLH